MAGPVIIADDGSPPPFTQQSQLAASKIRIGRQSEPMPNLKETKEHDLKLTKISRVHVTRGEDLILMAFNPQHIIVRGQTIQFHVENSGGSIKVHANANLCEVDEPGFGKVYESNDTNILKVVIDRIAIDTNGGSPVRVEVHF